MSAELAGYNETNTQKSIDVSFIKSIGTRLLNKIPRFVANLLIYSQLFHVAAAAAMPLPANQNRLTGLTNHSAQVTSNSPNTLAKPSELNVNSRQLGLSGPLTWGANYSDLTGTFFNAQYLLPLNERLALAAFGEYGSGQSRFGGTLGYGIAPLSQLKFTAERFGQRLPFQFDSGNLYQRVYQDAYGARFQQVFPQRFLQALNLGGYYADAANKNLAPVVFSANGENCGGAAVGLNCINYRHLAGAASSGVDAGAELLLTPSTWVGGNIYYDQVRYHTQLSDASLVNRDGLGAAVKINQLVTSQLKFFGEASVRKIYDSYQGGVSWLPSFKTFAFEFSLMGQHLVSHNATPNNNSINLSLSWIPGNKTYEERFQWNNKQMIDVAQWVQAPAVHMNQVLVIAEQITRLLAPIITSITPNAGSIAGGNIVSIIGSNFVQGTNIFFGGQLATIISVSSPSMLSVRVPPSPDSAPDIVNVVVQNPDGQQTTLTNAYTYGMILRPAITAVKLSKGSVDGGSTVTISGENFTGLSAVTFGGVPATIIKNKTTEITVTTPSHEAGIVDVVVTTDQGNAKAPSSFIYETAPNLLAALITEITPNTGSVAGGQTITISGRNFTSDTRVQFGDNAATQVSVVSPTKLEVITPPGETGAVDVVITNAGGNVTTADAFTYVGPPTIDTISPTAGSQSGGQFVTITGTNFVFGDTTVTFGSVAAASVDIEGPTQLVATTAASSPGTVDVTVTTSNGSATDPSSYTYEGNPIINSISPASGPLAGNALVTINGQNFTQDISVTFGANSAIVNFVSSDGTSMTVITPAGNAGSVNVTATNLGGTGTSVDGYTYEGPPTITNVSPAVGSTGGGQTVTITGTNFSTNANTVTFGGNAASSVYLSQTQLSVTTPPGSAGTVDVVVTTPSGTATASNAYTYAGTPTISMISPSEGPTSGGPPITITGTNFIPGDTTVLVGSNFATSVTVLSPTELTAVPPSGVPGSVDVILSTGAGSVTDSNGYTYLEAPVISSIAPGIGPTGGGQPVTITGTHFFSDNTTVRIGGNPATEVNVASDTTITALTPSGNSGTANVEVTTPGGSATLAGAYTYVAPPTIVQIAPDEGPVAGGVPVTIQGTNFSAGATTVTFGGSAATILTSTSNSITVLTPPAPGGNAGAVDVVVTAEFGSVTATDGYTYDAVPTISSLSPSAGPFAGGNTVTIMGSAFTSAYPVTVTFGANEGTNVVVSSNTELTVTVPSVSVAGPVDVVVTTMGGSVTDTNGYTYEPIPTISAITPSEGSTGGGQLVTITGTSFYGNTTVTIGGNPATDVLVLDATTLTAITPSGNSGTVDVQVTTPSGSADAIGAYTYIAPPTIEHVVPDEGPVAGGVPVTIQGTNFISGATTVTFGGNSATITSTTSNSISLLTPAAPGGNAGAVDVVVTTAFGSVTSTDGYTYDAVPTISSLSPSAGPLAGENTVTIMGSAFTSAYPITVTFGGNEASNVTFISDTELTVTPPSASIAGPVDVVVTTIGGSATDIDGYNYQPAPTISTIDPSVGPTGGGQTVTITGTGFVSDFTTVTIGGNSATNVDVTNSTTLTATTPSGNLGSVDVVVTTPSGSATASGAYTYTGPPTIEHVVPDEGPVSGGEAVTIQGTNFVAGATTVTFGGSEATITTTTSTSISVLTPAAPGGNAGAVDVVVTTPIGSVTSTDGYTYDAVPTISSLSPSAGPLAGGNTVTIMGSAFTSAYPITVTFGGNEASNVTFISDTELTVTPPSASIAGPVDVVVTTIGGSATDIDGYNYQPAPTISTIDPSVGPTGGGQTVTITGTGFVSDFTTVTIGGNSATNVDVTNSTTLTATTPSGNLGSVDVVVTTPSGSATASGAYTYTGPPTIEHVVPDEGPVSGGEAVTIQGTNFVAGATTVTFGGNSATINATTSTSISVTTPAATGGNAGSVDVVVTTPAGSVTSTNAYTYDAVPTISSILPSSGPLAGFQTVTIMGSAFTSAYPITVTFGGNDGTNVTVISDTELTVSRPSASTAGAVNVVVTTMGGSATDINGYTYEPVPTITTITPSEGSSNGGQTVTITGTGFISGETTVTFGANPVIVDVVSATEIITTTPAATSGPVNVVVTTPGGSVTDVNGYTYISPPAILHVMPDEGPIPGGQVVTLQGTNFTPGTTSVTFGGAAAEIINESPTHVTVITPAAPGGTAGSVDVVVTTPYGFDTDTDGYTYELAPTVSGISPSMGPVTGGQTITITGMNFIPGTEVYFDGKPGSNVVLLNAQQLTVTTPDHPAGEVNVEVTNYGGSATVVDGYDYFVVPQAYSIVPNEGPETGTIGVIIYGTGFATLEDTVVYLDGMPIRPIAVDDTMVIFNAPPHTPGKVSVSVSTPGGNTGSIGSGYLYLEPPFHSVSDSTSSNGLTKYWPVYAGGIGAVGGASMLMIREKGEIMTISPSTDTILGGAKVTIYGSFDAVPNAVRIGGVAATIVGTPTTSQVTVIAPAHNAGTVNIKVISPKGSVTLAKQFTYKIPFHWWH